MPITAPHIQLGLFAGCAEIADMHVVSSHIRQLADGSEVFVGEHLRWNGGRQAPRMSAVRSPSAPLPNQPSLFGDRSAPPDQPSLFDERIPR